MIICRKTKLKKLLTNSFIINDPKGIILSKCGVQLEDFGYEIKVCAYPITTGTTNLINSRI